MWLIHGILYPATGRLFEAGVSVYCIAAGMTRMLQSQRELKDKQAVRFQGVCDECINIHLKVTPVCEQGGNAS